MANGTKIYVKNKHQIGIPALFITEIYNVYGNKMLLGKLRWANKDEHVSNAI